MPSEPWYYSKNGQQYGPVELDALRHLSASGMVGPEDLVWTAGMPQWQPAGSLTQLMAQPPFQTPNVPAAGPEIPFATLNYQIPRAHPYGGFWTRFVAILIDGIIVGLPLNIFSFAMGWTRFSPSQGVINAQPAIFNLFTIAVYWAYFAGMESSRHQATLGKMAMGLRVTDLAGQPISLARASGRYFAKIISSITLCIGYMMAGWTERKQALHDKIAGTLVMRRENY